MKRAIFTMMLVVSAMVIISCSPRVNNLQTGVVHSEIFPGGNKVNSNNFTGEVWVNMLVPTDTIFNTQMGNVTFAPGVRSNWHSHPSGQILLVTEGVGYYQEKGQPVKLMRKGDVVKCRPNVIHWHGASPGKSVTHIAISPNMEKGGVVWLEKVTDEEYNNIK
ncbi:MAG TPA: cupin domain-containing protein [Sphingobacteriaceae bacterium]